MTKETHKYIIGVGGSIDPEKIEDKNLPNRFDGIKVDYDQKVEYKDVELTPTFAPRIGYGFTLTLE